MLYKCVKFETSDYLNNLIAFLKPTFATRSQIESALLPTLGHIGLTADNPFQVAGARQEFSCNQITTHFVRVN